MKNIHKSVTILSLLFLAAATLSPSAGGPPPASRTPVVVELFTSEGCSSCPPADRLLRTLTEEQSAAGVPVITLGFHVDYWNRLGWKDRFSSAQYSSRQSDYAYVFRNSSVYTPQMVVDGTEEFVGSDAGRARQAVTQAARKPKAVVALQTGEETDNRVSLEIEIRGLAVTRPSHNSRVWLAITEDNLMNDVTRGENRGRQLRHAAVVRRLDRVDKLKRDETTPYRRTVEVSLEKDWKFSDLRFVVFVQEEKTLRILGGGSLAFRKRRLPHHPTL